MREDFHKATLLVYVLLPRPAYCPAPTLPSAYCPAPPCPLLTAPAPPCPLLTAPLHPALCLLPHPTLPRPYLLPRPTLPSAYCPAPPPCTPPGSFTPACRVSCILCSRPHLKAREGAVQACRDITRLVGMRAKVDHLADSLLKRVKDA